MKETKNDCDLNVCFLCHNCLPEWVPAIAVHRKNFEFKKGEQIFKEGDAVNGMYFISKGTVKVHKRWDKEKDLIIRFGKPGDMLGHLGLGKDPIFPVTATALEPVVICYVDMAFFEASLKVNPGFTYKLMRFFADELQESEKRMRNLAHMSVKARIAQAFLSLMYKFGADKNGMIGLEITQQDISSYAGVSYETLFKVNQELKRLGIIEINGKAIAIKQEEQLIRIVKEDNQQ
ncbi:Crp/Fnr family transcriptional regulator [Pedobacter caeni]|uniref:CRP/FNR family transcriptional regulator, anaerobic regulatory protein n=1 Tax=Pedobacter caeni TaxID=288992 RepID=A0A1M4U0X5_9SPHI|nr:Crp/Fnr family transcriptional regulator [Pedobacter caeni]SHE50257.1 CRP/FNR family transcriptional regulator, anaerobic regulatory protein [Pedobacter caeni]